jgi:LPS export ABC transporter protein LptC
VTRSRQGVLALAAATTAASFGLQLHVSHNGPARPGAAARPDLYIEQPHWQQFDAQGRLTRQLEASRVEQWPGEQDARLIRPQLQIHDRDQRHWQLQAARGRLTSDGEPLLLEQQVVVRRVAASHGPVVTTERLNIARSGDLLETDTAVVLQSGNWHFRAGGLRAEVGAERIELFNRVRGIHE